MPSPKKNFSNLFKDKFQKSRVFFRHYAADCMPSFYPIMVEGCTRPTCFPENKNGCSVTCGFEKESMMVA